jgi:cell wall-associated NlpC family hydrolase
MGAAEQQAASAAATAKDALAKAAALKQAAAATLATAEREEANARQAAAALQTQQALLQAQLAAARQTVSTLQGQRAAALAYDAQISVASPRAIGRTTAGAPNQSVAATAIAAAEHWVGTRYAWGGGSLDGPSMGWGIDDGVVGFDCSGLTRYAYAQAGVTIPRQSTQQYAALPKVSSSDLQPGDLVFYAFDTSDPSTIHHVAMYLGNSQMIEAPESGERVHITAMRWGGFIGAARPTG